MTYGTRILRLVSLFRPLQMKSPVNDHCRTYSMTLIMSQSGPLNYRLANGVTVHVISHRWSSTHPTLTHPARRNLRSECNRYQFKPTETATGISCAAGLSAVRAVSATALRILSSCSTHMRSQVSSNTTVLVRLPSPCGYMLRD